MNEPLLPHGFYDGPVKELAARHLALIKAVFILLLVSVPGCLICGLLVDSRNLHVERTYYQWGSQYVKNENIRSSAYDASRDKITGYEFAGLDVEKEWYEVFEVTFILLAFAFPLDGLGGLIYRFYRLAKLLYPHLAFYFTALVVIPILNIVVILLLLRSALRQMRQMGLRVGVFGIDPARFA